MSKKLKSSLNKAEDVVKRPQDKTALWAQFGMLQADRENHQEAIRVITQQMQKIYTQIYKKE